MPKDSKSCISAIRAANEAKVFDGSQLTPQKIWERTEGLDSIVDRPTKHDETLSEKVDAAFGLVAQEVIARAERAGTDVLIWRDSQIVRLTPEQATKELIPKKAFGT